MAAELSLKPLALSLSFRDDDNDAYFAELLTQALKNGGYQANIKQIEGLTHHRQTKYLHEDKLSLVWRLRSAQRDRQLHLIGVSLTEGMIGQRVLLIPKGDQHKFDHITSLSQLIEARLVGGFGEGWFDSEVWQKNQLPYIEINGNTDKIYNMLASKRRGFDYFSRGVNEVITEARAYPQLSIEQRLLLIYPMDIYFYLPKSAVKLQKVLTAVLHKAKAEGLINRLIKKHWGDLEQQLQLSQRKKVYLNLP